MEEIFTKYGHIFDGQVAITDEWDYNEETSSWIRQLAPDEELDKWWTIEIPKVFDIQTCKKVPYSQ